MKVNKEDVKMAILFLFFGLVVWLFSERKTHDYVKSVVNENARFRTIITRTESLITQGMTSDDILNERVRGVFRQMGYAIKQIEKTEGEAE